jgi:hypothetical protein
MKMASSSTTFRSNTNAVVRAANGTSRTNSLALSVVDSTASRPPMIRIVVDAKNDGLADRFCTTTPSKTRLSRTAACASSARARGSNCPAPSGRVRARRWPRTA